MATTWDHPAQLQGRHRRMGGPPGWLGAPVHGDHRQDRLGPWHVPDESLLLRPPLPRPAPVPEQRRGPGQRPGRPRPLRLTLVLVIACFLGTFAGTFVAVDAAHASTASLGAQMLDWAEAHETGHPYVYGGTGPGGYDCSGAVYAAAVHVLAANGIHLAWPRDTYNIQAAVYSGRVGLRIIPVSQAQRGDLLIWPGWGHVEWKTAWPGLSYGAQHSGTLVGWHRYGGSWSPIAAIRVLG